MPNQTKTKLIWTVTANGIKKKGIVPIAQILTKHKLDGIICDYNDEIKDSLKELREELKKNSIYPNNPQLPDNIPFILRIPARSASLCLCEQTLNVKENDVIEIQVLVDSFEENGQRKSSKAVEIITSHSDQLAHLKPGSKLEFSYGTVAGIVTDITTEKNSTLVTSISCKITLGGSLLHGMDVSSPDLPRELFPLLPSTENILKDKNLSEYGDYVMFEGLKNAKEFFTLKGYLIDDNEKISQRHPSVAISKKIYEPEASLSPKLLLRIDSKAAHELLSEILPNIDGVFLSRSELGKDEHPNNLPLTQKNLISLCHNNSKVVLVASELMESMKKNSTPTRAEVSDIANAISDGADALILSHEVTEGPHAQEVASICEETIQNMENWLEERWKPFVLSHISSEDEAVTYGAIRIAEKAMVKSIVCFTEGGYTAVKLSSMRTPIPIIAITCNKKIMRQLRLLRSVTCVLLDRKVEMEKLLHDISSILKQKFSFKKGDKFVFVSLTASSVSARNSNIFTLQEIDG